MAALAESLRKTVLSETGAKSDVRFLFGTEHKSSFAKPHEDAYATWQPLPLSAAQQDQHALASHLMSRSAIFPRLNSSTAEVRNKLVPNLNGLMEAFQALDSSGAGVVSDDQLVSAVKTSGVFLSRAEVDQLLAMAPCVPPGHKYDYKGLVDVLLGKSATTLGSTGVLIGRPALPRHIDWPADQTFSVELRHRPSDLHRPPAYVFSAQRMTELARMATKLCREEVDAEKVHDLLRTHLHNTMLVEPGPTGHPDLSFRQWLAGNSIMSLTIKLKPGPIPPEVYDVFDQVIYDGLGIPCVVSATQTLTSMSASLKRNLD